MIGEKRNIRLSKCSIGIEEREAVMRVFDQQYLGMGREVQLFEQELKDYLKTDLEVICVNTGTAALHLALLCLDLKSGDEVLVPTITYVASFQAVSATGAKAVACDVSTNNFFINLEDAEKRITKNTKAIMPVHYASDSSQMDEVYRFAKKHNLRVIEDAAQAMGCSRNGVRVGTSGDILCFSFDGIKNITSGEGGMIVTRDQALAQRLRDARLLGVEKDTDMRYKGERSWTFDVRHQGFRYHMSDIMAAIGREQLKKLDKFKEKRRTLALQYVSRLSNLREIELLNYNFNEIIPHIFVVKILNGKRDEVQAFLQGYGISSGIHYFPNHLLSLYKTTYALPVAEKLKDQMLTLPLHVDLTLDDVNFVCEILAKKLV